MIKYGLYGLPVHSEIALPSLVQQSFIQAGSDPITIQNGVVPQRLAEIRTQGVLHQVNPHEYLLEIPGLARYRVSDGNRITIQADERTDENSTRLFLLGPALGALLHWRHILPIHGSCVGCGDGAVIFAGVSGSGKSTLAATFYRRGCPVLADEISVIQVDEDGTSWVMPGPAELKLWSSALDAMQFLEWQKLRRVRPEIDKYAVPVSDTYVTEPLPLRAIYILNPVNHDEYALVHLETIQNLPNLTNLIYQRHLALEMGAMPHHWETGAAVIPHVEIAYLNRPVRGFNPAALAGLVEKALRV